MLKISYFQFVKYFKQLLLFPLIMTVSVMSATRSFGQKLFHGPITPLPTIHQPLQFNWFNPTHWYNPIEDSLKQVSRFIQADQLRHEIKSFSLHYLGKPYRSAGKTPQSGFDCSGFTGFVFRNFGLRLKSSSTEQAKEGKKIHPKEATVGDLAFFGKKDKKGRYYVNHAAIVISKPGEPLSIIHSASNKGIVITHVEDSRYWRNALLFVRSVI